MGENTTSEAKQLGVHFWVRPNSLEKLGIFADALAPLPCSIMQYRASVCSTIETGAEVKPWLLSSLPASLSMHSYLQHLTAPPKEWPLPCSGALLTLIQSSSFQRGIGAFAGLSAELSPWHCAAAWWSRRVPPPTRVQKRKGGVRVGCVADSDAIKET